jgi:hypothetical protein
VDACLLLLKKNAFEKMIIRISTENRIVADWNITLNIQDLNNRAELNDYFASILIKITTVAGHIGQSNFDVNRKFKILVNIKAPLTSYNLSGSREPEDSWVLADTDHDLGESIVYPCAFYETRDFKVS